MEDALVITIEEPEADGQRLETLSLGLREDLLLGEVDDVRPLRGGPAPEGARAVDVATVGALLVSVKMSVEAVSAVVATVRSWLRRGSVPGGSVKLTIGDRTLELQAASPEQQERLVGEFLSGLPQE